MKNLTEGNMYKTFILFAIPLVLSGILSQGYNTIDTIIAGKFLGSEGLAAIGASSAFITLVSSVFWGYGSGFAIYAAKLFGAGDFKELKNVVCINIFMVFAISVLISLVIIVFRYEILGFLKADESITEQAAVYMSVYIAGFCFIIMNACCGYIMNSMGTTTFPFLLSLISAVLNIGGNIFTIVVLKWGVAGVALSTVFSAMVVSVCYVFKLKKCFAQLGVGKSRLRLGIDSVKPSLSYAGPVMIQQMLMYIATMAVSPMVNSIGVAATAAYTVITKIYDINAGIYQNSAKTLSNYTAQCVGAGKFLNLKKGVRVGLLQGIVLLLPSLLLCIIFAKGVCSAFFSDNSGDEALAYSVTFVRVFLPFIVINVINNLFHAFFRGTGSMKLLLASTFIGSVSRIFFSALLVGRLGMNGIYAGWVLSWAVEAVYAVVVYFSGRWIKDCGEEALEKIKQ